MATAYPQQKKKKNQQKKKTVKIILSIYYVEKTFKHLHSSLKDIKFIRIYFNFSLYMLNKCSYLFMFA